MRSHSYFLNDLLGKKPQRPAHLKCKSFSLKAKQGKEPEVFFRK